MRGGGSHNLNKLPVLLQGHTDANNHPHFRLQTNRPAQLPKKVLDFCNNGPVDTEHVQ